MGTWRTGSFGNDDALDFVASLSGFDTVIETVSAFSAKPEELQAYEASTALAACDLLAAGLGRPPADLPEPLEITLREAPKDVLKQARVLVKHIRTTSELAQLWEDDREEWDDAIDALLLRLTPSKPYVLPKKEPAPELPADFLGHCYVCGEIVTARDGFDFWYDDGCGGELGSTAHRACIDAKLDGDGAHWTPDGKPFPAARRQMVIDMGYEPEDLEPNGDLLPAARRRMMLEFGYDESALTSDGYLKSEQSDDDAGEGDF